MSKLIRKVIILIAVITLLMTGCGTSSNTDNNANTTNDKTVVEEVSTATKEAIEFPLKEKATLTAFVMTPFAGDNGDYKNNYVTDYLEKEKNIKIDFQYCVTAEDGKTKLNLMMASGDTLPDIFIATNWTKAETMLYGNQGLIIPLNEYLTDCPNWNYLNEVSPLRKGDLTMADGNVYTYGGDNECLHEVYQARMWIYQPWVDKLTGGKIPQTTDELYEYLKAVKENDPNGNGKADEVPLTGCIANGTWATDPTTFIINAFVQNNNMLSNANPIVGAGFTINNGKVEYAFVKDGYKQALTYLNKLYKEGLLDSQTFTQDGTQFTATTQSEEPHISGMAPGGGWPSKIDELLSEKEGPWQDWTILEPVKGPEGVQYAAYYPINYFSNCFGLVSKDCKNPELAVKFFDLLASEEMTFVQQYGPQGVAWDYTDGTSIAGGKAKWKVIPAPAYNSSNMPDYSSYGLNFVKYNWDMAANIIGNTSDLRLSKLCTDPALNYEALFYSYAKAYSKYKPDDNSVLPNLAYSEEDAKKMSEYSVSIGQYVNQATVQFITGDLNIETDWQSYLDKINAMDLKGYVALQQKNYDGK